MDPRFLEELLSLNWEDILFILTDLHAILNVLGASPFAFRNPTQIFETYKIPRGSISFHSNLTILNAFDAPVVSLSDH